jgi:hypothetical protein
MKKKIIAVFLIFAVAITGFLLYQITMSTSLLGRVLRDNPTVSPAQSFFLQTITKENYPTISFLDEEINIPAHDYSDQGWLTLLLTEQQLEIEYPNELTAFGEPISVGFCEMHNCQDTYPVIVTMSDEDFAEDFEKLVNCAEKTCRAINLAISPLKLGKYSGIVLWSDKLLPAEMLAQQESDVLVLPKTLNKEGQFILSREGKTYILNFDLSDKTQVQMLSTFKLADQQLVNVKNEYDEIKVFVDEYSQSLIENNKELFVSLLSQNTAKTANLENVPFGIVKRYDLLRIQKNTPNQYTATVRLWNEHSFTISQQKERDTPLVITKEDGSWKTNSWKYLPSND